MTARPAAVTLPGVDEAQARVDELVLAAGRGEKVAELDLAKALAGVALAGRYDEAAARTVAGQAEEARQARVTAAVEWLASEAPARAAAVLEARRAAVDALRTLGETAAAYSTGLGRVRDTLERNGPLDALGRRKLAAAEREQAEMDAGRVRPGPTWQPRVHGDLPDGVDLGPGESVLAGGVRWPNSLDLPGWIVMASALAALDPGRDLATRKRFGPLVPARATIEHLLAAVEATAGGEAAG